MSKSVSSVTSMTLAMLLASGLLALVVLTASAPARASFPAPNNGKIAFSKGIPAQGGALNYEIFAKYQNGTGERRLTSSAREDVLPGYSPNGKKIEWLSLAETASAEDREQLWVMNADGSGKRLISARSLNGASRVYEESWGIFSPDGDKVLFDCMFEEETEGGRYFWQPKDLCVARVNGSGVTKVTNTPNTYDEFATWSPDGEWIAFHADRCDPRGCWFGEDGRNIDSSEIYKIRPDGSGLTRLTFDEEGDRTEDESLKWFPSGAGTRIAFVREGQIFTMRPDGSEVTLLTSESVSHAGLDWSPSEAGAQIAYYYQDSSSFRVTFGIGKVRADGTGEVSLTQNPQDRYDYSPKWAPNGNRIAFFRELRNEDGLITYSIYTMKPDGSDLRLFAGPNPHLLAGDYDWQPLP